jgi:glycerol-3-phosphate acyltransferase PlsX
VRVAVDAMGAEKGIGIVIEGTLKAVEENSEIEVTLVGDEVKIQDKIKSFSLAQVPFSIIHAPEVIEMSDSATAFLKTKRNSSISVTVDLVREGKVDGLVSAGNTGAIMATSLLKLGKVGGVKRPCLAAVFPTMNESKVVILDVGANVDCRPEHLFQFAVMGSIYAYKVLKRRSPRVGLLSIGAEENKGNELVLQTHRLLRQSSLRFVGNIEGGDITGGNVEVVVCDGFVGNIILKFAEGLTRTALAIVNEELKSALPELARMVSGKSLERLKKDLDYAEYGGVPLMGVKGICVIAHGASSSKAIKNAILASFQYAQGRINQDIETALARRGVKDELKGG